MRPEEPEPGPLRATAASGATTQTTGWVSPAEGRAARGPPAGRACASFIEVSQTSDKQLQPLRLQPPLFESGRDSDTPVQLCTASHTQAGTMPV